MGKLVISSRGKQQQQRSSSSSSSSTANAVVAGTVAAAGYLTLRSGRRVPGSRTSQQRRGGAKSTHCCSSRRIKNGAPVRRRPRVVVSSPLPTAAGRPEQEEEPTPTPAPAEARDSVVSDDEGCGDSRHDAALMISVEASKKHRHGATDRPMTRSPPPREEMEAFFAAAELAERRRFSETYNYDVALDRPLEGRFDWAPVNT